MNLVLALMMSNEGAYLTLMQIYKTALNLFTFHCLTKRREPLIGDLNSRLTVNDSDLLPITPRRLSMQTF